MPGRKQSQPRAVKRSLAQQLNMVKLNGISEAAKMRWACNDAKRMAAAAAKASNDEMLPQMPQPPVIDSAPID